MQGVNVLDKEYLEEHAPVLALIATNLVSNPVWSLKLLDTTSRQLLLPMYRQERDTSTDMARAIEAGIEVAVRCPREIADLVALAHLLARVERLEESLNWIDQAIELRAGMADYHRLRASVLERLGRFKAAYFAAKKACFIDSKNPALANDVRRIRKKFIIQRVGLSWLFQ